jgi:uncharacterized integral membrane protein
MRIKTIFIILVTVLITVVLVQNTDPVNFSFLWATFRMPKLVMMTAVSVIAFILGVLVGRPNKVKRLGGDYPDDVYENDKSNTLSDEDRDYIS